MRIISGKHRGAKLFTLDGFDTRPTLDRVKEPLFSIINFDLEDSVVLDLFAGSGAIGLEALSRGAKKIIFCDNSIGAIHIIKKNVEKLDENLNSEILHMNFNKAIEKLNFQNEKVDIVFLDPPYESDYAVTACELIVENNILDRDGYIIIETDNEEKILEELNKISKVEIFDKRKYGRVHLIFIQILDVDECI